MRIGLDLDDAPAYLDLLSFLPPAEYGSLLGAAGFSADESPVAVTGTADPLLFDWRRVHQPVVCDDAQRATLAECLEAAGMRSVQSGFSDRPAQARRLFLTQIRSASAPVAQRAPRRLERA